MNSAAALREPIVATSKERVALRRLGEALRTRKAGKATARLVGPDGKAISLPHSLYSVLVAAVDQLNRGNGITILPVTAELTTQQAANVLNVSRPFVVKLLERGEIRFHKAGTHRRIYLRDLLAFKERREAAARRTLARSAREAQALGLYDE